MARALRLAELSLGATAPNPPVGAVIVKGGRVIGEGRHLRAGFAHAEVEAIDACRVSPRGATLYVTLEPCSSHGRTPPCTDLIIRTGIKRVVVGCADPNPKHAARGFAILQEAGIEVTHLDCAECRMLIMPFIKHVTTGMPFVTLKLGLTLDGRIADRKGTSQWITGAESRAEVQRLRAMCDAVMVGAETVRMDDPSLQPRWPGAGVKWRVVLGKIPAKSKVLTDAAAGRTLVVEARQPLRKTLKALAKEGIVHVFCEGGGKMAGSLIDAGLVDEYLLFYAPALLNDARARSGMNGRGFLMKDLKRLRVQEVKRLGEDILVRAFADDVTKQRRPK